MKIRNDSLQALQRQGEARAKPKAAEGGFDALFAQQLGAAQQAEGAALPQGAGTLPGVLAAEGLSLAPVGAVDAADAADASTLELVSQSIDGILGKLDAYAASLAAPGEPDLRGAYALLQDMDSSIKNLRETTPDLAARHAGMAAMVNELAVITTAETVKLNRGDYQL